MDSPLWSLPPRRESPNNCALRGVYCTSSPKTSVHSWACGRVLYRLLPENLCIAGRAKHVCIGRAPLRLPRPPIGCSYRCAGKTFSHLLESTALFPLRANLKLLMKSYLRFTSSLDLKHIEHIDSFFKAKGDSDQQVDKELARAAAAAPGQAGRASAMDVAGHVAMLDEHMRMLVAQLQAMNNDLMSGNVGSNAGGQVVALEELAASLQSLMERFRC